MSDFFLRLSRGEQAEILAAQAAELGRNPLVLEKDVWVCWVLACLFGMPGKLPMAFKGGTSLSKVFNVIERFSEDVDITIDYRSLDDSIDPFANGVSNTQRKKYSETLKTRLREHLQNVIAPHFRQEIEKQRPRSSIEIEITDAETIRVNYSSVVDSTSEYVESTVLIEFGGRNVIVPNELHEVRPYIAERTIGLVHPQAKICVLSPMRTYWEKATLIHVACNRGDFLANADRQSRHWYDLNMLAGHEIGRRAIADRALLADVVRLKKAFFHAAYADYDACLSGQLRLLPDSTALSALRGDFEKMCESGMFLGQTPSFDDIVRNLSALETEINRQP